MILQAIDVTKQIEKWQQSEAARLYLRAAYQIASEHSDDPRTHNGAVLVGDNDYKIIGVGVNQFPRNVEVTATRLERPAKYMYMEHAERNAIFDANGYSTNRATLFCPWYACADCARAIIQARIRQVVGHKQAFDKYGVGPWTESIEVANTMLDEAGVKRDYFDGVIGGVEIQFNGETWEP
jgi:dCMP deaminase